MTKAVFAGSFDPFTLGHKDIVTRAASLFDEVIVAVALDTGKSCKPAEDRSRIISASIDRKNVSIMTFGGLLTEFMKKIGVTCLVRGVRNATDYDYEKTLMGVYRSLYKEIEFVLFPAKAELCHISSTTVRQLCKMNSPIDGYVDTRAKEIIETLYKE